MVQHPTLSVTREQLGEILGYLFSEQEFSRCLKHIKFLEPKIGQFWRTTDAEAGI